MLARRHLGQAVLLAARLHLQEGDERAHLLLDRVEADERVELRLQLVERALRLGVAALELVGDPVAGRLGAAFLRSCSPSERTPRRMSSIGFGTPEVCPRAAGRHGSGTGRDGA